MQVQQFSGAANGFSLNTNDSCSQLDALSLSLFDMDGGDGVIATTAANRNTAIYASASLAGGYAASDLSDLGLLFSQPSTLGGGLFNLNLQPSGQGNTGSARVDVVVPTWLQYWWSGTAPIDPSAKVTFGIHGSSSTILYQRETR